MPIQGLTTQAASFVELGVIRKGGAKTDEKKPGPDLDYFRFVTADQGAVAAFKKAEYSPQLKVELDRDAYGDKPKAIEFVLPFDTLEENFEAWREQYVASGLGHRCDGVNCISWRDERGKMNVRTAPTDEKPCPTPTDEQRKAGGCKQVARLKIIIPALKRFAYITVTTTSIYDIMTMYRNLLAIQMVSGTLRGVPMILRRTEKEISTPAGDGKRARRKKWLLSIEPHPQWVEKKLLEQRDMALGLTAAVSAPLMLEDGVRVEDDNEDDELVHQGEVVVEPAVDRKELLASIYKGFDALRKQFKVSAESVELRIAAAAGGQVGELEDMEDEQLDAILKSLRAWRDELKGAK